MAAEQSANFEKLIQPLETQMFQTIWRILRNAEDVDDAHQHALIRIWRRWGKIKAHPNPPALVLRICAQEAYDALRRRVRQGRRECTFMDLGVDENTLEDTSPLACEIIEREETVKEILKAIAALPRKQAVAMIMRVIQQQSYSEIAAALECKEVTARSHVTHGRARLKQMLSHLLLKPMEDRKNESASAFSK